MNKTFWPCSKPVICNITSVLSILFLCGIITHTSGQNRRNSDSDSQSQLIKWTANPQFFSARSDQQRCAAISLWFASIRQGVSKVRRNVNDDVLNSISDDAMMMYSAPGFEGAFGKPFIQLTDDERKQIAKSLKNCSSAPWVQNYLRDAFTFPKESPQVQKWARNLEKYKSSIHFLAEPAPVIQMPRLKANELLHETDLYRLHLSNSNYACTPGHSVEVSIFFKVDESYEIKDSEEYWQRFEREMLPIIQSRCNGIKNIRIENHVAGIYIEQDKIARQPSQYSGSLAVSTAEYNKQLANTYTQQRSWTYFEYGRNNEGKLTSITKIREAYEKGAIENIARTTEFYRREEAARQANLAARRNTDRTKAAEVLAYYKQNAPERYNFSSYTQSELLNAIYTGDFDYFTSGYLQENLDFGKAMRDALSSKGFDIRSPELMKMVAMSRTASFVIIAFFAYHEVYQEQGRCRSNREMDWTEVTFRMDIEKTKGGIFDELIQGMPEVYNVRVPFRETLERTWETTNHRGAAKMSLRIPFSLKNNFLKDFRKFLAAEGCNSPVVRHLETNLYLAVNELLPAQELIPARRPLPVNSTLIAAARDYQQFYVGNQLSHVMPMRKGERVYVTAFGSIAVGPVAGAVGPDGTDGSILNTANIFNHARHGALMVRVKQEGYNAGWVSCGSKCVFTADRDGYLEFIVNDAESANNGGQFVIRIQTEAQYNNSQNKR